MPLHPRQTTRPSPNLAQPDWINELLESAVSTHAGEIGRVTQKPWFNHCFLQSNSRFRALVAINLTSFIDLQLRIASRLAFVKCNKRKQFLHWRVWQHVDLNCPLVQSLEKETYRINIINVSAWVRPFGRWNHLIRLHRLVRLLPKQNASTWLSKQPATPWQSQDFK